MVCLYASFTECELRSFWIGSVRDGSGAQHYAIDGVQGIQFVYAAYEPCLKGRVVCLRSAGVRVLNRLAQLLTFYSSDPSNVPLVLDILDARLEAGDFEDGLAFADGLDGALRMSPAVRLRVARLALSISDVDLAIAELSALLASNDVPQEALPAVRHDLAFALFSAGRLAEAETALAPLVMYSADMPDIGVLHARLLYQRGDLQAASLVLAVVTDSHPGRADAWGLAALVQLDMGASQDAAVALAKALAVRPDEPLALLARGGIALQASDAKLALSSFQAVVDAEPANGRARGGLGEALLLAGQTSLARDALAEAGVLQSGHLGTWHALAWSELLLGDVAAADTAFRTALELDRNFAESHGGLAVIYALQDKRDLAEQALRRARRLDPEGGNALYAESLLLSAEGNDVEADAVIRRALSSRVAGVSLPAGNTVAHLRTLMTGSGNG